MAAVHFLVVLASPALNFPQGFCDSTATVIPVKVGDSIADAIQTCDVTARTRYGGAGCADSGSS
jgi:hypothetical protein